MKGLLQHSSLVSGSLTGWCASTFADCHFYVLPPPEDNPPDLRAWLYVGSELNVLYNKVTELKAQYCMLKGEQLGPLPCPAAGTVIWRVHVQAGIIHLYVLLHCVYVVRRSRK